MKSSFKLPEFSFDPAEALTASDPFEKLRQEKEAEPEFKVEFSPLPSFARKGAAVPGLTPLPSPSKVPAAAQELGLAPIEMPKGVVNTSTWSGHGTHVTDGLDLNHGQKTAVDIMAKPGTAVGAPADGVVVRLGSAQGGDSMYFKDTSGKMWWLGHVDSRFSLPPGTRVRAGQTLTRISADHAAPHLHLDREL